MIADIHFVSLQSSSLQCIEEKKKYTQISHLFSWVAVISPIVKVYKNKINRNTDGPSQQPTKRQPSYNTSCSLNKSLYSHNLSIYKLKIHVSVTALDLHLLNRSSGNPVSLRETFRSSPLFSPAISTHQYQRMGFMVKMIHVPIQVLRSIVSSCHFRRWAHNPLMMLAHFAHCFKQTH